MYKGIEAKALTRIFERNGSCLSVTGGAIFSKTAAWAVSDTKAWWRHVKGPGSTATKRFGEKSPLDG